MIVAEWKIVLLLSYLLKRHNPATIYFLEVLLPSNKEFKYLSTVF
jgi:hypothetical protein